MKLWLNLFIALGIILGLGILGSLLEAWASGRQLSSRERYWKIETDAAIKKHMTYLDFKSAHEGHFDYADASPNRDGVSYIEDRHLLPTIVFANVLWIKINTDKGEKIIRAEITSSSNAL